jgi:hypothetical protein
MDQSSPIKVPLSRAISECIEAGMLMEEGAQYVGIYDDGYRLIYNLLRISREHKDVVVRMKAQNFLDEFDNRGGIGVSYRMALRFTLANKLGGRIIPRKKADRGMTRLRISEKARIEEFANREDLTDDEHSEAKRIQASIVEDKIASVDYVKLRQMILKYYHREQNVNRKVGWRRIDEKTKKDAQALLDRADVSDADKKTVSAYLNQIKDGRIKVEGFIDITQIVTNNRINKKERARRIEASKTFENALVMACQACNNLDDMTMPVISKPKRIFLVAEISRAAASLLQLQNQLIETEEANDEKG